MRPHSSGALIVVMVKSFWRTLACCAWLVLSACTPSGSPWGWSDGYGSSESIWQAIRDDMQLADASHIPAVRKQIQWYQAHPKGLTQDMTHAAPYLYYVLSQTHAAGLPSELALIPFVESGYNPFAYSWVGATGLWQMMPGTASGLGIPINWWYDGRRDIILSTQAALDYFTYLHELFQGDWLLSIAAYDTGEGRVQRSIAANRHPGHPADVWTLTLPKETQHYLPKLLALQSIIRHPQRYHFELPDIPNRPYLAAIQLKTQISLEQIAKLAGVPVNTIRQLNPGFRRWSTEPKIERAILLPIARIQAFQEALDHDLKIHPKHSARYHAYTVQAGDSLSQIAHRFHTSVTQIRSINHLKSFVIRPGQSLLVPSSLHPPTSHLDLKQRLMIAADHLPGPKQVIHTVQKGQQLDDIAHRYGVKPSQMRFWNRLKGHTNLAPGQHLIIWKKKRIHSTFAVVKPGDSLSKIAHQHQLTIAQLKQRNHLTHDVIRVGQKLRV